MRSSKAAERVSDGAYELVDRGRDFATSTALPAVRQAAHSAGDALGPAVSSAVQAARPRIHDAADTVRPVLQHAAVRAQHTANDSVLPVLQSAAATASDRGRELWEALADSDQGQELARRAALVAAGAKGKKQRRWPLLVGGLGAGLAIGTVVAKKRTPPPPPPAPPAA